MATNENKEFRKHACNDFRVRTFTRYRTKTRAPRRFRSSIFPNSAWTESSVSKYTFSSPKTQEIFADIQRYSFDLEMATPKYDLSLNEQAADLVKASCRRWQQRRRLQKIQGYGWGGCRNIWTNPPKKTNLDVVWVLFDPERISKQRACYCSYAIIFFNRYPKRYVNG